MIERELGRPVRQIYSGISPEPVAAASLGQVYRARLASDGREVAVKVRAPETSARERAEPIDFAGLQPHL